MVSFARRLLVVALAGLGAAGTASAQTYTWSDDGTSTAALNWSAGVWTPGVPPAGGSATTALRFNRTATGTTAAGSRTFTNDIGSMTVNSLAVASFAANATGTVGALTLAQGANVLTLDGAAPGIQVLGPGNTILSGTGGLALNAATTVSGGGAGYLSVTAPVAGAAGLTINHLGTSIFSLSGANTFVGDTILNSGYFQVSSAAALGAGGNQLVVNGGAVRFGAAVTVPNNVVANQTFVVAGGTGALTGTSTPTLTGVVSGAGGLRLAGVNTTAGVTLQGANTYTGATSIQSAVPYLSTTNGPALTLSGAAGAIASTQPINVRNYGLLQLTNAAGSDNADRVPNAAPLNLVNGRLGFTGIATSSETLGAVTATGAFGLTAAPTGATSQLNLGALTRVDLAVVVLNTSNIGAISSATTATNVFFSGGLTGANAPLTAGSGSGTQTAILPYAAASSYTNPRSLVTYDNTNGLQVLPFSNAAYFAPVADSAALLAAANQNVATSTTAATYDLGGASLTINSLANQASGSTFQNGTLTVFSGAVTNFDPTTYGNGLTLAFGPRTGYIIASWNQRFTGTASITGSAGLVVGGFGNGSTYTTTFENTTGNPFTGGLFVNGATTLGFNADNQLGNAGGAVTLGGGELSYNGSANLAVSRSISINDANGGFNFNITSGLASLGTATAATTVTLSGVVSGPGAFIKGGVGAVNLAGANTYAGGTSITGGALQFTTDANLGAAGTKVTLNGGTLQNLAAVTTTRPVDIVANSTIQTDANLIVSGKVANVGGLYGTALPTLSKSGTGTLTLTGDTSQLSGNLVVAAGGLTSAGTSGLAQVANITLGAAGTTLTLDNTAGLADKLGDTSRVRFTGAGLVSYLPPTTTIVGAAERFGVLESAAAGGVFSVSSVGAVSPVVVRVGSLVANAALTLRGTDLGGTAGNYTRILVDAFATNQAVLPNVFFANTAGTATSGTAAGYDIVRGVIQFTPVATSGTSINNFSPDNVQLTAAYTTTGNTTAATGASVYSLVLDGGSTLTLNGGNAASATNANTPDGTLNLSGGLLTSQNGAKTVTSVAARTVSFGASLGQVTTTSDLTLDANVTLAGTGGLTKLGTGTLAVNGPYTVTGATTLSAGVLALGQSGTLQDLSGAGSLNFGANTLTVNSTAATTFSGALTGSTGGLVKTGPATFTLAPTTAPALAGGTTVAQGTLLVGNGNAATAVLGGPLTLGSATGNTSGVLDLNGFSPAAALTGVTTAGTGTGNALVNSNATALSTVGLNYPADATQTVGFGGNLLVGKADATTLTLNVGTVNPVTTAGGTFNVQNGVLSLTAPYGIGPNMGVTVSPGAEFRLGTAVNNGAASTIGTIALNGGGKLTVPGGSSDYYAKSLTSTGGSTPVMDYTGSSNFWLHFTGAGISVTPTAGTAEFVGPGSGSRIQNDTAGPLPVVVAAGGTGGVGLRSSIPFVSSGTNPNYDKQGAGVLLLANPASGTTTHSGNFTVSGGVLQLGDSATPGNTSGTIAVGSGGVLRGFGNATTTPTASGAVTVNSGGFVQGGDPVAPTGTLSLQSSVTLTNNGGLRATVGAGSASLVSVSAAAGVFNLNPGAGNKFVIDLVGNPADPLVAFTQYTYTLGSVATAGNIQLNGTSLPDGTVAASNYTLTGIGLSGTSTLSVAGNNLVLVFTPVPEPATVLAVAGLGLGAVRLVRRRRATA